MKSSGSHLILKFILEFHDLSTNNFQKSSLVFVDLAGFEKSDEAETEGEPAYEGMCINKKVYLR